MVKTKGRILGVQEWKKGDGNSKGLESRTIRGGWGEERRRALPVSGKKWGRYRRLLKDVLEK